MKQELFPFVILALLIPLVIVIVRVRVIDKRYYWFLIYLGMALLGEICNIFIKNIFYRNIIQNIHSIIALVALINMLFDWGYLKNNSLVKKLLIAVFILLPTINFIFQNKNAIIIQWAFIACTIIWILLAIQYISTILNKVNDIIVKASKILILVPLMVTMIYFTILQILMGFLFNPKTEHFFIELYNLVLLFQIASSFCFGIALILAPKKEKFLRLNGKA